MDTNQATQQRSRSTADKSVEVAPALEAPALDHGPSKAGQSSEMRSVTGGVETSVGVQMQECAGLQAKEARSELQMKGIHERAADGVSGSGGALPYMDKIQAAFGAHDVSNVQAHTGGKAAEAAGSIGALAYTRGSDIAFSSSPDLHTAAHEAAHVVQQRSGVSLDGGVGKVGDSYEKHADAVADAVVSGKDAEPILTAGATGNAAEATQAKADLGNDIHSALQLLGTPLDQEQAEGEPTPEYGEDRGKQRRFSREQYISMWEEEQGRPMTAAERKTIMRGCIGITATNLSGGGNPLRSAEHIYDNFDQAHAKMVEKNKAREWMRTLLGDQYDGGVYVMYAKMFWSNQSDDPRERMKPAPDAYKADENGEVDMTGYKYHGQVKEGPDGKLSGYVNFDYAFWDDSSQSFWHANHMEYDDPVKAAKDPMKVLQSTRSKFARGYIDFDRTIYCVALAKNYDPGLAALMHAGG